MKIDVVTAAGWLLSHDRIGILTHKNPDGDTLGSAYALHFALKKLGKSSSVMSHNNVPRVFSYLSKCYDEGLSAPECYVAVDIASPTLLEDEFAGLNVSLCIDHHPSNTEFAEQTLLCASASATCEIIDGVVREMGVMPDKNIANCLYTGIATDTGCFKYSNTTPSAHRLAAEYIELLADVSEINRAMFDTKTKQRLELERQFLSSLEYFAEGRVAVGTITQRMMNEIGAEKSDIDGIAAMPRQIEGVEVGVTVRENEDGSFKISMRTNRYIDASAVCARFGGGGHVRAAGFSSKLSCNDLKREIVDTIKEVL